MYLDDYFGEGYYDEYGNWVVTTAADDGIPEGHVHDEYGRLLKPYDPYDHVDYPEDIDTFISKWSEPVLTSPKDWAWSSKIVFPDHAHRVVILKRLDLYEFTSPKLQQGTTDINISRSIRCTEGWTPVRSLFLMDEPTSLTIEVFIESTGPPRRCKYRPNGKQNQRDLTKWILKETVHAYMSPDRIPGTSEFFVDFLDLPDRYFITNSSEPPLGSRRMYRFAAYSVTQYYILEKYVQHEALDAEGGYGYTYLIVPGPVLFARRDWKVIGSFYGFDHQLTGSSQYTVYTRSDPFPRVLIARDRIQQAEEWDQSIKFFAFDIPTPNTSMYKVQHCLRSIYSAAASIPRHRMTRDDPIGSWEFRLNLYLPPAFMADCTITQDVECGSHSYGV